MNKEIQLWEPILSIQEICCDSCKKTAVQLNADEYQACEIFYADGWRKRTYTYCPKCAKKKLKNLN